MQAARLAEPLQSQDDPFSCSPIGGFSSVVLWPLLLQSYLFLPSSSQPTLSFSFSTFSRPRHQIRLCSTLQQVQFMMLAWLLHTLSVGFDYLCCARFLLVVKVSKILNAKCSKACLSKHFLKEHNQRSKQTKGTHKVSYTPSSQGLHLNPDALPRRLATK
ncbi:hypothetical protein L7F22_056916 [Adiantum nelumboides]|nr:hypothetical protein [Adiantum nelumboides]